MKLVLFLTYGGSLKSWSESRIIERELALYRDHVWAGYTIHVISYGSAKEEKELAAQYKNIFVHYNSQNLHPRLYATLIPFLHFNILSKADVYKTNQMFGAHIALRCKKFWGKPLVIRQGFGYYENICKEYGENSAQAKHAEKYEQKCISSADKLIFTTQKLASVAQSRYKLDENNIHVIPNYIVPETWSPAHKVREKVKQITVSFFGRLSPEKNLANLLLASIGLNVKFVIIGDGPEKEKLLKIAKKNDLNIDFLGAISQKEIKNKIKKADFFALVSKYEGHPKSLIEATYLGIPVIASNSSGVAEVFSEHKFPIVCSGTIEGIRVALKCALLMTSEERRNRGEMGRDWAQKMFSVSIIAEKERSALHLLSHFK